MSDFYVHYREEDGEIFGYESTENPSSQPGLVCLKIELEDGSPHAIDSKNFKIQSDKLVEKTVAEKNVANTPALTEVAYFISCELRNTDQYAAPPPDRPFSEDLKAKWIVYRQALRELSKLPNTVAMINAWPPRPDGYDAIEHLRARI